jgi:hypothetical protein
MADNGIPFVNETIAPVLGVSIIHIPFDIAGASQTSFNLPADYLFRPEGLAQAFGISAFTFGHPIVFYPCYEQMRNADKLFMPTLLAAIVILVTGFIAMGTISGIVSCRME